MPGLDRTGPAGAGPMTGGGFGLCNPYYRGNFPRVPIYGAGRGGIPWGGGRGRVFGGGRGVNWRWPHWFPRWGLNAYATPAAPPTLSASEEREYLEKTLAVLKEDIQRIETRLNELASAQQKE